MNSSSRIDGNARHSSNHGLPFIVTQHSVERASISKASRIDLRDLIQRYKDTGLKEVAEARASLNQCRKELSDSRSVITVMRDAMGRPQTSSKENTRDGSEDRRMGGRRRHTSDEAKKGTRAELRLRGIFKSASYFVIKQLTKRYNKYLDAHRIPDQWEISKTVPLFREGERDRMKNCCPIALLP
uniref:Transposase n=1 Tax=Haemonchus contortus TaxID=6289 RepID=A0A7I4Z3H8_HAECO